MMRPLWLLVALVAAAADKNKALVVTDPEEKPLYLFGHIPKCGGVSFVADLVGRLHLTSCFGRKAVVAKGENWTHARSQFAHCQTPGNRAKWKLDKSNLQDWVTR